MKHLNVMVWSRFANPILAAGGINVLIVRDDLASCICVPYQRSEGYFLEIGAI